MEEIVRMVAESKAGWISPVPQLFDPIFGGSPATQTGRR
jgi:hypothetical protein